LSEWVPVDPGDWYLDGRIAKLLRPVEGLPQRVMILSSQVDEAGSVEVCPLGESLPTLWVPVADLAVPVRALPPETEAVSARQFWQSVSGFWRYQRLLHSGKPDLWHEDRQGSRRTWKWVQYRTGFREVAKRPVPQVDYPFCDGFERISTQHWLSWKQANAITMFSLDYVRALVPMLAGLGLEPTDTWVHQSWREGALWPNFRASFMDPHGERNATALVTELRMKPDGRINSGKFKNLVADFSASMVRDGIWSSKSGSDWTVPCGPLGWTVAMRDPSNWQSGPANDGQQPMTLRIESAMYYEDYGAIDIPRRLGTGNWPLNPADEWGTRIYPGPFVEPEKDDVPASFTKSFAVIREWGRFLGFTVGEPHAAWHQESGGDLTWQRYILTAPVTLTEDITEIARRAKPHPYSAVTPLYLDRARDTPIDFRFGGHRSGIYGGETPTLKIESCAYNNKKLQGATS